MDSLLAQGSNDYGSGHIPTTELWVKAYTDFVRNVSATYSPPPEIFLTVSHCVGKNESIKCESHSKPAWLSSLSTLFALFSDLSLWTILRTSF